MNGEDTALDLRDLYFLGLLAERSTELIVKNSNFPRGCDETQTLMLSRAGYLTGISGVLADGTIVARYQITPKGQAVWRAYWFV